MDLILTGVVAMGAFGIGALIIWILRTRDLSSVAAKIAPLEAELGNLRTMAAQSDAVRAANIELEKKLASATTRVEAATAVELELGSARQRESELAVKNASLAAQLSAAAAAHEEQVAQLTRMREEVQSQFKLLAGEVLKTSSDDFVKRADEIFKSQRELTSQEIDKRSNNILELIKPLGVSLKAYDEALKEIEKVRIQGFSTIDAALQSVNAQHSEVKTVTASLVNALRASPKTRGRWGEETLRRVMELSGMVEHCDFETEKHFRGEDESLRPDVLINVTGSRVIVVDAKAPVSAYLDALSATSEEERETLLKRHAAQLRERLVSLSSKSYWEKIEGSLDCVVMFVPGDNFVSAAFERDPDLFEDAIKARVLICTPTTFIALAKALSFGWRQQRLAQNASDIAKLGKDLYARLATMGGHIVRLSSSLKNSVDHFNKFVGSVETSVMPQARKFQELGVEGTFESLPELPRVDYVVRPPQPGRDLRIPDASESGHE